MTVLDEPSYLSKIHVGHFTRDIQEKTVCFDFVHQEQEAARDCRRGDRVLTSEHTFVYFCSGKVALEAHSLLAEGF